MPKSELIRQANASGEILREKRRKQAKELADILGSPNILHKLQEYFLPEFDPAKKVKGQPDVYAKVQTEGVPMEYIGYQFSVITEARQKLLAIFNELEEAFEPDEEKKDKKVLRK